MDKTISEPQEIMVDKDKFDAILHRMATSKPMPVKDLTGTFPRRVATVPRIFQIKLRVPPVPRIWGPVLNAIQNLSSCKIAVSLFEPQAGEFWSPELITGRSAVTLSSTVA
jgi:hypothetical protein